MLVSRYASLFECKITSNTFLEWPIVNFKTANYQVIGITALDYAVYKIVTKLSPFAIKEHEIAVLCFGFSQFSDGNHFLTTKKNQKSNNILGTIALVHYKFVVLLKHFYGKKA